MGGGLAQAMFTKVADKFYDLVVQLRRRHHRRRLGPQGPEDPGGHQLTNQKNLELKALDEDFRKVLEEDK